MSYNWQTSKPRLTAATLQSVEQDGHSNVWGTFPFNWEGFNLPLGLNMHRDNAKQLNDM